MPTIRKERVKEDQHGNITYRRTKRSGLVNGEFVNLDWEYGNDDVVTLQHLQLYFQTIELEHRMETSEREHELKALDILRQILRDNKEMAQGEHRLLLDFYDITENLGLKNSQIYLQGLSQLWQMKKERIELDYLGQRIALDKEALEVDIGKAELNAFIEVKKLEQKWIVDQALIALKGEELTQKQRAEAARLLLMRDQFEHQKQVDARKLSISEKKAVLAFEEFNWKQKVDAATLYFRKNAQELDWSKFQHQQQIDHQTLELKTRAEQRLQETLVWDKEKGKAELRLAEQSYELDLQTHLWDKEVDQEKLQLGWAGFHLEERKQTSTEKIEQQRLEQGLQHILLKAREVKNQEKQTDNNIEIAWRQDDRAERTLEADINFRTDDSARSWADLKSKIGFRRDQIRQGDERNRLEGERVGIEARNTDSLIDQRKEQIKQGKRHDDLLELQTALDALYKKGDLDLKGRAQNLEEQRAQVDAAHKAGQLRQGDERVGIEAARERRLSGGQEFEQKAKIEELGLENRKVVQQGEHFDKKLTWEQVKEKIHHEQWKHEHVENVRHNLTEENIQYGKLGLDATKAVSEVNKNRGIEESYRAQAHAHEAEAITTIMGEMRRTEEMVRTQNREDRQQVIDHVEFKENLELHREKNHLDFAEKMRQIERLEGKDRQIFLVKTLGELVKLKEIDEKYKYKAKQLQNEIVKARFQAGTKIVTSAIKFLSDVVRTVGYVGATAITTAGKVIGTAIAKR